MSEMACPQGTAAFGTRARTPSGAGSLVSGHRSTRTTILVLVGCVLCLAYAGLNI